MNEENKRKITDISPLIRRTSISKKGKITETQIPLSALRKEAMDLSAGTNLPTTLLLTREAAMQITEQAISCALDNAWSNLIRSEERESIPSSPDSKMTDKTATSSSGNSTKSDNSANYSKNLTSTKTTKGNNHPQATTTKESASFPNQMAKDKDYISKLPLSESGNNDSSLEQERVAKKKKVESKSNPEMASQKKKGVKKSASSPASRGSKMKGGKPEGRQ